MWTYFISFLIIYLCTCGAYALTMYAKKGAPLAKEEVALLIDLVVANKVVTSKATNAAINHLKEDAWNEITIAFNESPISRFPRRIDQLKLKWDNLKKKARERHTKIRKNHIENGDKPEWIQPDYALDRVAAILGSSSKGHNATEKDTKVTIKTEDSIDSGRVDGSEDDSENAEDNGLGLDKQQLVEATSKQEKPKIISNRDIVIESQKRKLLAEDLRARSARNRAIADYYITKKKKLQLDIENMELINRKLKLELEQLK